MYIGEIYDRQSEKFHHSKGVAMQIVEFCNMAFKALEPAHKDGIVSSRKYKVRYK